MGFLYYLSQILRRQVPVSGWDIQVFLFLSLGRSATGCQPDLDRSSISTHKDCRGKVPAILPGIRIRPL